MKKKILIPAMVAMFSLSSVPTIADPIDVTLEVCYKDPYVPQGPPTKSPIRIPEVSIDGSTLTFHTSCDGCLLQIVDEEGEVAFATIIPDETTTMNLPAYLSGDYELQIIRGNYCFYGYITL